MATNDSNLVPAQKPQLQADHTWYNSLFTQLLAPLVATRYIWLAIEEINPFNFLGKTPPADKPNQKIWKEPSFLRYASRNFAAFGMGTTFLAIVGTYSKNTLKDIKSIYAEAVGYELGKKTEDVTLTDVFIKSNNEAIKTTCNSYLTRTLLRMTTASAFFIPWHKLRSKEFQAIKPKYDVNANAGVGAIGIHIYGEGFLREPSFFDIEQKIVSSKINHKDVNPYAEIQIDDIQSLLALHRKHLDKNYVPPLGASPEGQNDVKLAKRITELFNCTYDNIPPVDNNSFTLGKLNYLVGFGLLDKFPESLAYVELANKSVNMKEVKQAATAIKDGQDPQAVFLQFGIDMHKTMDKAQASIDTEMALEKFTKKIQPKSFMDFATRQSEPSLKI